MPYFSFPQISLGFITFNTWGICVGLAFVAGLFYAYRKNKSVDILNLALLGFLGAVSGAAFLYYLLFGRWGGFVFYGGLFGGLLAGWLYIFYKKLDFWPLANLVAPAIALGIFIGRIGCFLIKDHQGITTGLPWGVLWPDGITRHPIALYLSLNGLILFLLLHFFRRKKPFIFFLTYYAASRFLLDFLRVDPRWFGLTVSQIISLVVLCFLAYGYFNR